MKPTKVEFAIGKTISGQTLRLAYMHDQGKHQWVLFKDAANQRDEQQAIYGIPGEAIVAMAEAVKSIAP